MEANEFIMTTPEFFTDQVFGSREDMMNWVKNTAYSLGYVIVTQRSKQCKNGLTNKLVLRCDRGGKPSGSGSSTNTSSKKTDGPFNLVGKYSLEHHYWTIRVVCGRHNHHPTVNLEGHAFARRLSDDEFRLVEDLTWKGVPPHEILSPLKDRDENNLSTLATIYEAQKKIRMDARDGKTPMQFLMSLLQSNRYVYQPYTHPVTNELQALFFVHPISYEIWRAFPHVLIIDATYKTNIYHMPFVQIVGVTSTGKTFCIAFVFISEEKMDNYKWALEQLKLMLNECMHPRVIVTDRELALMKACEIVFPQANHLLCRWHIGQNILKNCKQTIKSQRDWYLFESAWKLLQDSPTWISYTENYEKLRTVLSEYPRVLRYVHDNWLDKYKNYFVSASIDQCLNFGNRTTNRVESQHAKLKNYMLYRSYTLDKFVLCIDKIVKSQLTAIKESFGKSEISRYHKHNIPCFSLLRGVVSNEALKLMVKEIDRSNGFQIDSSTCGCQLYSSCGLPCACRISLYMNSGECIPLDSIDIFWRTLNLSPTTSLQSDNIRCDTEINHFKENFNKQSEAGKRSFIRKLVDIFNPSKTTMKPPTVKRNTRGRPSLKKQQQQQRQQQQQQRHAPPRSTDSRTRSQSARFFGIDLNVEPERHSSYTNYQTNYDRDPIPDLNEEQARHSLFADLYEEPTNFFDYIQEPARHSSYVQEPVRHSSYVRHNSYVQEPARHSSYERHSSYVPDNNSKDLMKYIPGLFHRYIISLHDVFGDGNCGFRLVAVGLRLNENRWPLIRQHLLEELDFHELNYTAMWHSDDFQRIRNSVEFFETGFAPQNKWMIMPNMGFVIASRYNRPVVCISPTQNYICFPLWSGPNPSQESGPIVIAHVRDAHYIYVMLDESCPIPPNHQQWRRYKTEVASAWETIYLSRQRMYTQIIQNERQMYS